MLDWTQLEHPEKRAFFEDAKKIIAIRKAEADLIHAFTNAPGDGPNMLPVNVTADAPVPVPYLMSNTHKAILVAGNRSAEMDVTLKVALPLVNTPLKDCQRFQVIDLWGEQPPVEASLVDLQEFSFTIKKDKQPGGGLAVYRIVPY